MLIYWLRNDFRLNDNEALSYLLSSENDNFIFFSYDKEKYKFRSAQKWWLYKTLKIFDKKLSEIGVKFIVENDLEYSFLEKIIKNKKITEVCWNKIFSPEEIAIENNIIKLLEKNNIKHKIFSSNLLQNPDQCRKKDNTPFQVFTPFWKNAEMIYLKNYKYKKNLIKSKKSLKNNNQAKIETILPKKKWYEKFEKYWFPGEDIALKKIKSFNSEKINFYDKNRDFPSIEGTSKLSPHLAFGEISPKKIYDECTKIKNKKIGVTKFLNEIGWREFAYHLINHFPIMLKKNLRKNFDKFPWSENKKFLDKWKKGNTGYPIVDAAMKQLYETGWMHNRLRMVVGSFLVKHLRINWTEGEKYFKDTLLDYDTANNVSGWQWIAGCGADAAPYFRIFNPITQGEKFDPNGEFVKYWIPNLKKVPKKFIHKPWELPEEQAKLINFNLIKDYFEPIVDHKMAREAALKAFEFTKK